MEAGAEAGAPCGRRCIVLAGERPRKPPLPRLASRLPNHPPPAAVSDPPFEVRESPIQGLGAFATRPIPAGTRLIEYAGERLTPEQSEARYPDEPGVRHHTYLFAFDYEADDGTWVDVVVDASVGGNAARFLNHSCDPNCDVVVDGGRLWIETVRDVAAGEESGVRLCVRARGAALAGGEAAVSVLLRGGAVSGDDVGEEALDALHAVSLSRGTGPGVTAVRRWRLVGAMAGLRTEGRPRAAAAVSGRSPETVHDRDPAHASPSTPTQRLTRPRPHPRTLRRYIPPRNRRTSRTRCPSTAAR
jgi:hypothetical protein